MTCISTICVYDDLTTCKSCISVWSADHETACRIYEEFCLIIDHFLWKDRIEYIFLYIIMDLLLCNIFIMLCRKYNCLKSLRLSSLIILYRNLCFSVWTKICKSSVFSYLCKLECKLVCKCDRIRHILFCLVCCISKHHSLISGTCIKIILKSSFFCFKSLINAHCNICRLLIN